jgi:hypothetical protein
MKKILLLIIISLFSIGCRKEVEVKATVVSHVVTSDRAGSATYRTIVKTDDGYAEQLIGLKYYVIPEGKRVTIKVYR